MVVGVVLSAVLGVLVWSVVAYRSAADESRAGEQAVARANRLEKLVLELETGARGFVITGQERFLEPWKRARTALASELPAFERLEARQGHGEEAGRIARDVRAYLEQYTQPLVATARRDRRAAASVVAMGEGKRRVDGLRAQLARLVGAEQRSAEAHRRRADSLGTAAITVGLAGLVGAASIVALFYAYLSRAIVRPVRALAHATGRLAAGDLSARVPDAGRTDELGTLGASFNTMARTLEDGRDELESQNAELHAQQDELERVVGELARERDLVVALHRFAGRLNAEVEVEALALATLETLGDVGRAHIGAVYAVGPNGTERLRLVSSRGLHPEQLDPVLEPGGGLAGRAVAERVPVTGSYGENGLVLSAWGEEVTVRHELHLPLVQGDRVLGVVSLGRVGDPGFGGDERGVLESMADQAGVALSNVLALRQARREAGITRAVLDETPDAIALIDARGTSVLENAPMAQFVENVIGVPQKGTIYDRLLAAADVMVDPDQFRVDAAELAADPQGEFRHAYTVAAANRTFQRYVAPVRDSAGVLLGRLFVVRDMTAERQAERLKDELVATVSHELRTPLTSIIGYLELVLGEDDSGLREEERRFLGVVDRNARRLLDVVGDLLFVAQVEAGRLALELVPLDVHQLVAEAADSARPLAAAKEIELAVEVESRLVARGDRVRLAQMLANLVSNAVKFTPAGGRVDLRARARDGTIVLEVADTGIGVPEEEQARMFQRFFRSSTAAQHAIQGTGLGLVIAKAIAEAHGGSISFTSTPGAGTTFRVELPVAAAGKEVQAA